MKVKINKVIPNKDNPRLIKDYKFKKLVDSIKEFPEMLEKRPIVVDEDMIVLGGNMRLKACQEAGLKEVDILIAKGWTEEQKKEFIIKDNVGFGEWDWDILANNWDNLLLEKWGLDGVKYDWNNLDYIEEELDAPDPSGKMEIKIIIPDEYKDVKNKLTDDIKNYITENYLGCEVK
tara:strand:+ start:160 stop:687 length:528 start_codon:yes stop_codon:yes gene_type:complete